MFVKISNLITFEFKNVSQNIKFYCFLIYENYINLKENILKFLDVKIKF